MYPTATGTIGEGNEEMPMDTPIPEKELLSADKPEEEDLPEEVKKALKTILDNIEHEDEDIRITELRNWRQLQLYAKGIMDIYWDELATDWRSFSNDDSDIEIGPNRNINIFRAHMESVVAALSVKVPTTIFFPDDADNPEDCETADAYSAIADLLQKHNKSPLQIIKIIYIMWTQGTVAAYNYYKIDPKYGSVRVPKKVEQKILSYDMYCDNCGNGLGLVKETPPTMPLHCDNCKVTKVPQSLAFEETIERIVDYTTEPKGRVEFDFFGPINVKIPFYARKQSDIGYLLLKLDPHFAMLRSIYDADIKSGGPGEDTYERWIRLTQEYQGNIPRDLCTIKSLWIRPWMYFSITNDDSTVELLLKTYPNGAYCTFVNDKLTDCIDENLDDHWTISIDPLSDFIHNEPLGKPLQPIQDMRNDLVDLSFKTIEYGISENFVDPQVVDFNKYKEQQATPGMLTPAKSKAGQTLGESFFQTTPAHLSAEVQEFGQQLDTDGQFVVGDFPSVYGGPSEGSKTAFEYDKSNAQALQRLSLTWKRLVDLWTNLMSKAVVEYAENMKEDEKNVKRENGRFINTWIRKESLNGKIGSVEPETSEQLPQSWEQKWHLITNLLQMQDPAINSVLLSPENAHLMKQAVALPQFYVPGDHDRTKQFGEIYDLIANPQDQSVQVGLDEDDHPVHERVIKHYLTSPQGIHLYKSNPMAYQAIIQHYRMHKQAEQELMMQQGQMTDQSNAPAIQQ